MIMIWYHIKLLFGIFSHENISLNHSTLALISYLSLSLSEVSFKKGQTIDVIRQIDENWYEGEVHGKIGIFPSNYVEVCIFFFRANFNQG